MIKTYFILLSQLLIVLPILSQGFMPVDQENSVFTVSHTRSFRKNFMADSLGTGKKIAFTSYTYPEGERDALYIYNNGHAFGSPRVSLKEQFAKVFGWAQDYKEIEGNGKIVGQRIPGQVKIHNIIIDWKKIDGDLEKARNDLDDILDEMKSS